MAKENKEDKHTDKEAKNITDSIAFKNKIFKYKDGSVARVCYDVKDSEYITINVN